MSLPRIPGIVTVIDLDGNQRMVDTNNINHVVEEVREWAGDEVADLVLRGLMVSRNDGIEQVEEMMVELSDRIMGLLRDSIELVSKEVSDLDGSLMEIKDLVKMGIDLNKIGSKSRARYQEIQSYLNRLGSKLEKIQVETNSGLVELQDIMAEFLDNVEDLKEE